ncbi:hypothetical protein [Lapidilactobacillus gannanensis]|jgi:hypothetical protein|uniref:Uncharacterized protein n=1 Tax=Lapidilactobacillus gannanensis TaxID=2486002 RepID=A0ABW4BL15_9LACO|nr:hypothetical protein [Lapidilactobacillus gannanensis]MCH4056882.1 hypothetical protein [Lactobacillaceae bacterium]
MEIGTLAEWVAGISELLAVIVALFLPMYNAHRQNRKQEEQVLKVSFRIGKRVIQDKADHPETAMDKLESYQDLRKFSTVVSLVTDSTAVIIFLHDLDEILVEVDHGQLTAAKASQQIDSWHV